MECIHLPPIRSEYSLSCISFADFGTCSVHCFLSGRKLSKTSYILPDGFNCHGPGTPFDDILKGISRYCVSGQCMVSAIRRSEQRVLYVIASSVEHQEILPLVSSIAMLAFWPVMETTKSTRRTCVKIITFEVS